MKLTQFILWPSWFCTPISRFVVSGFFLPALPFLRGFTWRLPPKFPQGKTDRAQAVRPPLEPAGARWFPSVLRTSVLGHQPTLGFLWTGLTLCYYIYICTCFLQLYSEGMWRAIANYSGVHWLAMGWTFTKTRWGFCSIGDQRSSQAKIFFKYSRRVGNDKCHINIKRQTILYLWRREFSKQAVIKSYVEQLPQPCVPGSWKWNIQAMNWDFRWWGSTPLTPQIWDGRPGF